MHLLGRFIVRQYGLETFYFGLPLFYSVAKVKLSKGVAALLLICFYLSNLKKCNALLYKTV